MIEQDHALQGIVTKQLISLHSRKDVNKLMRTITVSDKDCRTINKMGIKYAVYEELEEPKQEWNDGDDVWTVHLNGVCLKDIYRDEHDKYVKCGQAFHTKEEAEKKVLRMRAGAKRWLPEYGQVYCSWNYEKRDAYQEGWIGAWRDINNYHLGNTHRTKEECEEWGKEFGKGFEV